MIKVKVSAISRAEGQADNTYRDLDNSANHKTIIVLLYISRKNKHAKARVGLFSVITVNNNFTTYTSTFVFFFNAYRNILHRRLKYVQITQLSASR